MTGVVTDRGLWVGPARGTWGTLDLFLQGPGLPTWRGGHVPLEGFLVFCPVRPSS